MGDTLRVTAGPEVPLWPGSEVGTPHPVKDDGVRVPAGLKPSRLYHPPGAKSGTASAQPVAVLQRQPLDVGLGVTVYLAEQFHVTAHHSCGVGWSPA